MPRYDYRCTECGHLYEKREGFDAPAVQECPVCSGTARRVLTPPAIVFKGSGWYVTDSRKGSGSDGASHSANDGGSKTESSSTSKETSASKDSSSSATSSEAATKTEKANSWRTPRHGKKKGQPAESPQPILLAVECGYAANPKATWLSATARW
jgi:putative FmdB family regulatory protein